MGRRWDNRPRGHNDVVLCGTVGQPVEVVGLFSVGLGLQKLLAQTRLNNDFGNVAVGVLGVKSIPAVLDAVNHFRFGVIVVGIAWPVAAKADDVFMFLAFLGARNPVPSVVRRK